MPLPVPSVLIGLAALAAVLALVLLSGRAARALLAQRPQAGRRLALRETLALDPRRRLVLVACDGREALLAVPNLVESAYVRFYPPPSLSLPALGLERSRADN